MDLMRELENSKEEIFRFEALQEYFSDNSNEIEKEISKQFKETGEIDMDLMKDWHEFIQRKTSRGVKMIWIRLLKFPLNEYTKSEVYIYKKRLKYGIDIHIITEDKFNQLKIKFKDFYLIDKTRPIKMNYGKSNEFLNCQSDKKNILEYIKYRKLLIRNSIPINGFNY